MADQLNGSPVDLAEHLVDKEMKDAIATVNDEQKRDYMARIWNLPKDQIFHELMRVHMESAKMLTEAFNTIEDLKSKLH